MKDSILVRTLQSFTSEELDQFGLFLESHFFNEGSHFNQNIALFCLLKDHILTDEIEKLDKTWISQTIFNEKSEEHNEHYLENRMSELLVVLRKFITWQEVTTRWGNVFEGIALAHFYKNRGLIKLQEQAILKAKKIANNDRSLIKENPIVQYWIDDAIFSLENYRNKRKGDLNIPALVKSLTIFFAVNLLEISLAEVQQDRVDPEFNPTWNVMIQDMRRLFRIYDFLDNPTILMLEEALILIEDKIDEPFLQLQKYIQLLNRYENDIPNNTIKNIAAYARNYCTLKINQGYRGFRELRINLYKTHLKKGWLFENDKLNSAIFINMINVGLWSDEKEWVSELLKNYKDKISGPDSEKVIHYGFALYYANEKNFENAKSFMNRIFQSKKFGDMSLERLVRVLEIKILFEENDDFIYTQLHNFLMFIRRSQRMFDQKSRNLYINFVKNMKRIMKLKEETIREKSASSKLSIQINKIENQLSTPLSPIVERLWLLEKINEIKALLNK